MQDEKRNASMVSPDYVADPPMLPTFNSNSELFRPKDSLSEKLPRNDMV
jgi:hypothetical protein